MYTQAPAKAKCIVLNVFKRYIAEWSSRVSHQVESHDRNVMIILPYLNGWIFINYLKAFLVYLWMPEHCIQRVMPRLMLAQRGSGWPQSQQQALPGMAKTFCRALSPFSDLSFGSPPESRLPVDVDDFLSSFWWRKLKGGCLNTLIYWLV